MKAYQWLQNQNPNIKELATTPDLLCSLYLKAQMQGNEALDRPSLHNFKTELKSLAGMIGEFETAPAAEALTEASLTKMNLPSQPPPAAPASSARPPVSDALAQAKAKAAETSAPVAKTPTASASNSLDSRSHHMIQEVKTLFNLSSEGEALNLLISVGYTKLKRFIESP